ncbi:MAG: hypothetical protein OQL06_13300 [Gammaproteobacteria bacterium]|nr:hypothetical protein [Gammaproteobacteria bacterium]
MFHRLYFLLPNEALTQNIVTECYQSGVSRRHIHVHGRNGIQLKSLPKATMRQRLDVSRIIEKIAWNTDLVIFFAALIGAVITAMFGAFQWSALLVGIMLVAFILGYLFAGHVPRVHLDEFNDALHHGEILLMIDVPAKKVAEIERLVERHHPAAIPGGASWTLDALGI